MQTVKNFLIGVCFMILLVLALLTMIAITAGAAFISVLVFDLQAPWPIIISIITFLLLFGGALGIMLNQ